MIIKAIDKFHVGLLVMSLTITSIMVFIYLRISYLQEEQIVNRDDLNEDEMVSDTYYEYNIMGEDVPRYKRNVDYIELLKNKIRNINMEQRVYYKRDNWIVKPITSVIVVQVHNEVDMELLEVHLYSLKYSMGMLYTLVIFSHDSYDNDVNNLIKKIGFPRYMQIYYPYSTQLFPDSFPGPDSKFCTDDFQCEISETRDVIFAQKKHFWWWQMNHVFDKLNVTKDFNINILFLEVHQFVVGDFMYVAKIMESVVETRCPECEMLILGAHAPELAQYRGTHLNLTISSWNPDMSSAGIAFNKTVWNSIKSHSSLFCNYNDYRWEASLRHIGLGRDKEQFIVLISDSPRVIKYCKDESYGEDTECLLVEDAINFTVNVRRVHKVSYPNKFNIKKAKIRKKLLQMEDNIGEWKDDRDQGLCMHFAKS